VRREEDAAADDGVQCGHFRTGRFQSFQRILEEKNGEAAASAFLPDGMRWPNHSAGFSDGAFWVREAYADCWTPFPRHHLRRFASGLRVALKILEVIQRDHLAENARETAAGFKNELLRIAAKYPAVIRQCADLPDDRNRIGGEIPALTAGEKSPAVQFINRLHEAGALAVPSGTHIIRILPR